MKSQYTISLQEEYLKLITTKTLDLKPLSFADFLEVLLTVAGLVVGKQCGLEYILVLARLGLVQKSGLLH